MPIHANDDVRSVLDHIEDKLQLVFKGLLAADVVRDCVESAYAEIAREARFTMHLPVLAEHEARARLNEMVLGHRTMLSA